MFCVSFLVIFLAPCACACFFGLVLSHALGYVAAPLAEFSSFVVLSLVVNVSPCAQE
mgnify:CR=1 FL=1